MDTNAQLAKWRHLIEPELLRCATPLSWADLQEMPVRIYERSQSVLVTSDAHIGGQDVRTVLVTCGIKSEVASMVEEFEADTRKDGLKKIMFIGRRGWLRVFKNYREVAVIGERSV